MKDVFHETVTSPSEHYTANLDDRELLRKIRLTRDSWLDSQALRLASITTKQTETLALK